MHLVLALVRHGRRGGAGGDLVAGGGRRWPRPPGCRSPETGRPAGRRAQHELVEVDAPESRPRRRAGRRGRRRRARPGRRSPQVAIGSGLAGERRRPWPGDPHGHGLPVDGEQVVAAPAVEGVGQGGDGRARAGRSRRCAAGWSTSRSLDPVVGGHRPHAGEPDPERRAGHGLGQRDVDRRRWRSARPGSSMAGSGNCARAVAVDRSARPRSGTECSRSATIVSGRWSTVWTSGRLTSIHWRSGSLRTVVQAVAGSPSKAALATLEAPCEAAAGTAPRSPSRRAGGPEARRSRRRHRPGGKRRTSPLSVKLRAPTAA